MDFYISIISIAGATFDARIILLNIIHCLIWSEATCIVRYAWQCSCCLRAWPPFTARFYISPADRSIFLPYSVLKVAWDFLFFVVPTAHLGHCSRQWSWFGFEWSCLWIQKKLNPEPVVHQKCDSIMHTWCSVTNHLVMEVWHEFASR